MPTVGEPTVYLAGAIAILAEYPILLMERLSDPRIGTQVLKDYPTLSKFRAACEELYAPMERQARRDAIAAQPKELQRPPRTPEQQARIDRQVDHAKRKIAAARMASEADKVFNRRAIGVGANKHKVEAALGDIVEHDARYTGPSGRMAWIDPWR